MKNCPQHGEWDEDKWRMCPVCALHIAADLYRSASVAATLRKPRVRERASLLDRMFPTELHHFD
jgi:hypothetical protein